jgi:hypothetical protein
MVILQGNTTAVSRLAAVMVMLYGKLLHHYLYLPSLPNTRSLFILCFVTAVNRLAAAMVMLYDKLRQIYSMDDHRHYLFNPRDLTDWAFGLLRYDLSR